MGTTYVPTPILSGFRDTDAFDTELTAIRDELENMVNRQGTSPNAMAVDLDIGTNQLLNVDLGVLGTDGVNLTQVNTIATSIATSIATTILGGGAPSTTGDPITINYAEAVGSQGTGTRTVFDLTALFGITGFTGLSVFVDGVSQQPSTYTISSDTTVTFSESLDTSTDILFVYGDISPVPVFNNVSATLAESVTVATAGLTVATAPTYVIGQNQLIVSIDGLLQSITQGDYAETSTTSITLDEAMVGGEVIVVREITGA
jgi:hypothetical protein